MKPTMNLDYSTRPSATTFGAQDRGVPWSPAHVIHTFCLAAIMWLACGLVSVPCVAQTTAESLLYEREPFDRITLDAVNKSAVIDVFPIDEIRSGSPLQGKTLVIRRLEDPPSIRFSVEVKHIAKIERFEELLLREANRAISSQQIAEAFQLLGRLKQVAPDMPGLQAAEEAFFFADTRQLFRQKRYDEALLSLDEVYKRNPQRKNLPRALNNILSQIINTEFAAEKYGSVLSKLDFAKRKYGTIAGPLVEQWETQLRRKAAEQFSQAETAFAKGEASEALLALRRASETWPQTAGIDELKRSILARFPRIRVGVSQQYVAVDATHSTASLLNWATRRSEPLVLRQVVKLSDFTVDGAQYQSDLGQLRVAPDRQSFAIKLSPDLVAAGHRLTQQLLILANPNHTDFSARWAEYVQNLYLDTDTIQVQLSRSTLNPEGLLPRTLRGSDVVDLTQGDFQQQPTSDSDVTSYVRRNKAKKSDVGDLTESLFDDPTDACDALADGRLDLVDRIHPGDYDRLAANPDLQLIPYRLPTIHGLVFSDREPLLRNATFRRGLLYGIDRQSFLNQELTGTRKQTAQLLSGFAPIGRSENDPLGYAYNPMVKPRSYDPSLAVVLMRLAMRTSKSKQHKSSEADTEPTRDANAASSADVNADANIDEHDPNAFPSLTLAYPDSHIAAAACESIASNWRRLGLPIKLRPLSPGHASPKDGQWDLLYIEATIEEPLVDLPELVLGHRILGRHGGLVWHAMRQLQEANSLEEVRDEFAKIHRLTFDHTPILPLWQIIEHIAVREGFSGPSGSPISLYEDIDKWRVIR